MFILAGGTSQTSRRQPISSKLILRLLSKKFDIVKTVQEKYKELLLRMSNHRIQNV